MNKTSTEKWKHAFPLYSWLGLGLMVAAQVGLLYKIAWVATWLTPIMWTGYILLTDGLLYRSQGKSWLTNRRKEFPFLLLLSIAIWLVFEAYNFHLQNWLYKGVPEAGWVRNLAYGWSFATIIPGVFLSAELIGSALPEWPTRGESKPRAFLPGWFWVLSGSALVIVPLTLPIPIARYLFGAVWLGFILLFDPINQKLGAPSLRAQWRYGNYKNTMALLIGGLICGLLWEAWNFQAFRRGGGHWVYTVPDGLRVFDLHYGQMPIMGMLGFPPFALELYLMYHFARSLLGIEEFLGKLDW